LNLLLGKSLKGWKLTLLCGVIESQAEESVAASGDQMGDLLSPLEAFRVKRVIPLGS